MFQLEKPEWCKLMAVWCSGNGINKVVLHRARLVLWWVTARGWPFTDQWLDDYVWSRSSIHQYQHAVCRPASDQLSDHLDACVPPFPQIDIIRAVVIVWRVRGKTIRSVLCNIVCNNCAQFDAHTYEQTNSSLDWVLSHWAHFTVLDSFLYCVLLCVVCMIA